MDLSHLMVMFLSTKTTAWLVFFITLITYLIASVGFHVFDPSIVAIHFGHLLGALNCTALLVCACLYVKGRFLPSTLDHGHTGNVLFDYYWGTELHPSIFGFNIKQVTNCRIGMMGWPVIIVSFAFYQHKNSGLTYAMIVSVLLQLIYIAKFFWWERGYFRSLDIMHDRAGFYICWGCLVWVPSFYTIHTMFQAYHPVLISAWAASLMFMVGVTAIMVNAQADQQRMHVRASHGKTMVAGKPPVLIRARYITSDGIQRENLLLASGWWGLARHFHYVPEIIAALAWTAPAGTTHLMPYLYVIFLSILLIDRAFRDDRRCTEKYGTDWLIYTQKVPWKLIPGIF